MTRLRLAMLSVPTCCNSIESRVTHFAATGGALGSGGLGFVDEMRGWSGSCGRAGLANPMMDAMHAAAVRDSKPMRKYGK